MPFWIITLVISLAGLFSVPLACFIGPVPLEMQVVKQSLLHSLGLGGTLDFTDPKIEIENAIVQIRLARISLAYTVGAGLALAGVAFQGILRNPLADPFTLGVSGGAALGASLALTLGIGTLFLPYWALGGAVLSLLVVLLLSLRGRLGRESLILAGVVVSAFLSALIALIKALNEDSIGSIVFWIMGSLQNRGWADLQLLLPLFCLALIPLLVLRRDLDILNLGSKEAQLLGLNVNKSRLILLVSASALSAACVSVAGIIGFVGIIIPHLLRMLQGPKHVALLLNSFLAGGLLLLWADTLARSILPGGLELPVGVITALLGGPFFCLVLNRKLQG